MLIALTMLLQALFYRWNQCSKSYQAPISSHGGNNMRTSNPMGIFLSTPFAAIAPVVLWTPAEVTTNLWLDAADTDTITDVAGAVSQWDDKSGNINHATQGIGVSQPTTGSVSLNGLNSLEFDGTGEFFDFTNNLVGSDLDIYIVNKGIGYLFSDKTTSFNRICYSVSGLFYWNQDNTPEFVAVAPINRVKSASQINRYTIENLVGSTTEVNAESELSSVVSSSYTLNTLGRKWSGATGIPHWTGNISEVIICQSVQSAEVKAKIEGYLAWKWGLEASLPIGHPYKSAAPTVESGFGSGFGLGFG